MAGREPDEATVERYAKRLWDELPLRKPDTKATWLSSAEDILRAALADIGSGTQGRDAVIEECAQIAETYVWRGSQISRDAGVAIATKLRALASPGERLPIEFFHPGIFLHEEMTARGWNDADVAERMNPIADQKTKMINALTVQAIREQWIFPDDPDPEIGPKTAAELGRAFGVSPDFWLNLDKAWHSRPSPTGREG